MWKSTVVEHHRLREDIAVVRLIGDAVPFTTGQFLTVTVPNAPHARRLSPALPPSLDGKLEFHVRAVPGGWVSGPIVTDTRPGDVWQLDAPAGGDLHIDDSGRDVVLVAGGTGLAPLRALIVDLTYQPHPPRVFLFVGGRNPRDLYAGDMLALLAAELPWLTVIPVVERIDNPGWTDDWHERTRVDIGFTEDDLLLGRLPDVVAEHGPFRDHQVLVCGSPGMTAVAIERLTAGGTPAGNIRHDPI
ncbi:FAD-binding oxidoreductase [Aldersonia sp. NBC_00410]|uniref:FAD-binding oxidoreductase n=1 Tax=Aldersonia sp. NBC_00410 TaxID=2975954 RepID=UPI0022526AF1|nr:FAD-binding oxidoreductase [Aldersonia sp. NBC_00410]MCX5042017.1 FAD-binding oxidoreductase [Aldersonia sp. NBC_00410]